MAFQSVPETAEVVIAYEMFGEPNVNVLAARLVGGYAGGDLSDLAAAVDASVGADWLPLQVEDVAYVSTTVRGLEDENDLERVSTFSAGIGELVEIGSPGNVTLSVKKLSGFTGRSARGRLYWIGMPRSNLSANLNRLDQTAADAIEAAIEATRDAIDATAWKPVIISRFTGGAKRTEGVTFDWISTVIVDLNVDSQRRRLAG